MTGMDGMGQISWLLAAARFLHWGACLLCFGAMVFLEINYLPAWKQNESRGAATNGNPELFHIRNLVWVTYLLAVVSGLFWFWVIAADMGGNTLFEALKPGVAGVVWGQTQVGAICHWRAGLAVLLGISLCLVYLCPGSGTAHIFTRYISLLLAGALLATLAWTGHGTLGHGWAQNAHLSADALHLVLAAIWPGGLVPLAIFLSGLGPGELDLALAKRVVGRFSLCSVSCVLGLTLTGLVNSLFLIGSIEKLFDTFYGQLLTIKLTLFAILICCGAFNLFYLSPRLTSRAGSVRKLSTVVLVEILGAMVLLGLVSVIGLCEPSAPG